MKIKVEKIETTSGAQYIAVNASTENVLNNTPHLKTEKGIINWALKNGYEIVTE
jgi:hypothetical protein